MPGRIVAWPMYAIDPPAVEIFWQALRRELRAVGLDSVPEHLTWPEDLYAHWQSRDLLLTQTCGYPFTTRLADRVRYVATPCFRAPGCVGPYYSSAVVVRRDDGIDDIAGCAGKRVAFNGRDSQSGYNALRALVAPLAKTGRFFADTLETGAHRLSLNAVTSGKADVAAIDTVTFTLISAARPATIEGLKVLTYTDQAPGLPFVTSLQTSASDLALLRRALTTACASGSAADGRDALLLDGVEVLPVAAYDMIGTMRDRARTLDYPELG